LKNIGLALFICLFLFLGLAYAGDSQTFAVSCTIPALPGVNAPLLKQEQLKSNSEAGPLDKTSDPAQEIIQQDSQPDTPNGASQVLVETFYAR